MMVILILVSVSIVIVLGGLWLYTTRQSLESDIYTTDIQDSQHMAESVSMYLDDINSNAEIVSSGANIREAILANDSYRLTEALEELNNSAPRPDAVNFVDNAGHIRYSTARNYSSDISGEKWFDDAMESKSQYTTGLYKSTTLNGYAFAVLTPICNNTTTMGWIIAIFSPENFQNTLKAHNLDPRDNIIVVDQNGNVVSSNSLDQINVNTDLSKFTPVRRVINGSSGVMTQAQTWDGRPRITAYQPIPGRSYWGVIVSTPVSVEYQPLYELLAWIVGILTLSVIAVSMVGYIASRYLTDPILQLSGTMREVSGGRYDLRVETGRSDEIGELAVTFNMMMDRLEDARTQSAMYLELMGHDINNMNQIALGYLELADSKIESGGQIGKNDTNLISKPIEALEDSSILIGNIMKIQMAKTGELPVMAIDICNVLSDLKSKYSHISGRDIKINLACTGRCEILANDLIRDVFSNLIWNAIKHSDTNRPLDVNLTVTPAERGGGKKFYCIAVEDNGPGIPDDIKKEIFFRFRRGKTKAKGSGLGLFIVKSLAEIFHGKVWVEDRVAGDYTRGCRFVVMLPAK